MAPLASLSLARVQVMDVEGRAHAIGTPAVRASALVFLSTECPISARYLPELNGLAKRCSAQGVELLGVLSDPSVTRAEAAEFEKRYAIEFPVIFDASGELASRLRPVRVPEAFLVAPDGGLVYRGRIDDAWRALGKPKARVTRRDLEDSIEALLSGKAVPQPRTTPIGCIFESWGAKTALPAKVTWTRDVAPLVGLHCAGCHRPGQVGPFPLLTYADASKRAKMLAEVTESRYMPPWHAEPGFGRFRDEHLLGDREIAIFAAWRDQGAPEGDAKDLPPPPSFPTEWALGPPDLVVEMPKPFEVHASGDDIYRAFALPTGLVEDKFVTAIEVRPGAPSVLHHAFVMLDSSGTVRRKEREAGSYGIPAFSDLGFTPSGSLGGWLPGVTPRFFPEGIARFVPKKSDVIIIAHYHPNGKVEKDQTRIGLYFAKKPPTHLIQNFTLANQSILIPAGDANYERRVRLELPRDIVVVGIMPHMHLVGREMKVTARTREGEVRPAVWIRHWNFRWQDQYIYDEPQRYARGTTIELEAHYDNSQANPMNPSFPPKEVRIGWGTTDEMCECLLELLLPYEPGTDPNVAAGKVLQELYKKVETPWR